MPTSDRLYGDLWMSCPYGLSLCDARKECHETSQTEERKTGR